MTKGESEFLLYPHVCIYNVTCSPHFNLQNLVINSNLSRGKLVLHEIPSSLTMLHKNQKGRANIKNIMVGE